MGGGSRSFHIVVIVLIITIALPANLNAFPNYYPPDEVDLCIFACDRCYKGQSLVNCANNCIDTEGNVDTAWRITCPFLDDTIPEVQRVRRRR